MKQIILASRSPRRKQLLEWAEVPFIIVTEDTDESFPPDLTPESAAIHIAMNKGMAIHRKHPDATVISADTIVVLNERIIGKPENRQDAINILSLLSGKHHKVITGVSIIHGDKQKAFADITDVLFYELTRDQIEFYVDKYRPYDKAGAYAIQEWIGVIGIKSVKGDFYNVMGLPVSRVVRELKQFEDLKII